VRYVLDQLEEEAGRIGRSGWRPMLRYVAGLHGRSIKAPRFPLSLPWEEIGPGYASGPAFGHWDIVHAVMDSLPIEPEHAANQIRNVLSMQQADGLLPGSIWMGIDPPAWNLKGHPPVWVYAVEEYCRLQRDDRFAAECFEPLHRNIKWYEARRRSANGGFFYTYDACWESGVDEGIRFDRSLPDSRAAVDATSHVFWLYRHAARWAEKISPANRNEYREKAEQLQTLIQSSFFDAETGFFHDSWSVGNPELRRLSIEGIWPLVTGAASPEQAERAIDENLLEPQRFFTVHPLSSVAVCEPAFEPRMWRGPAWNSMTCWAAVGCMKYGRYDAAEKLLERALDASARQFQRTGTIWEFYDSLGGEPEKLHRKPGYDRPCHDYLGHNPLIAMTRLWEECHSLSLMTSSIREKKEAAAAVAN